MFYAFSWLLVFGLLALWSLGSWAFHAVAVWTVSNAGSLVRENGATEVLRLPDWLAPWLPQDFSVALNSMVSAFTPAIQAVLAWAPALAGGLSVAVWVVWAIGSALLVVLGLVATGLIAMLRGRASTTANRSSQASAMR